MSDVFSNEELILLLALHRRRRRLREQLKYKKRFWVRKIFVERQHLGAFHTLVQECKLYDHEFFFKLFRMSPAQLEELVQWVAPLLVKSSMRRQVISVAERLCVTIRHLASGDSHVSLAASYRIGLTTISRIIPETCEALCNVLLSRGYMSAPNNPSEWKRTANGFELKWDFPNCMGAIDGKHIVMVAPGRSGSVL